MNTSHNKDLIIDDGLKTTILNACKLPFNFPIHNTLSHEAPESKNDIKAIGPNDSSPVDLKDQGDTTGKKKYGVFTISESIDTSTGHSPDLPNSPASVSSSIGERQRED